LKVEISKFGSLEEAKESAVRRIDEEAEKTRLKYLTSGSGQAMEYTEVRNEAERYLLDPSGDFPFLQSDITAEYATTLAEAAENVLAATNLWKAIGSQIRDLRLSGKKAVSMALTQKEVAQIREAYIDQLKNL
jgi:hypothetical protein